MKNAMKDFMRRLENSTDKDGKTLACCHAFFYDVYDWKTQEVITIQSRQLTDEDFERTLPDRYSPFFYRGSYCYDDKKFTSATHLLT